jgi:hypothetical protein
VEKNPKLYPTVSSSDKKIFTVEKKGINARTGKKGYEYVLEGKKVGNAKLKISYDNLDDTVKITVKKKEISTVKKLLNWLGDWFEGYKKSRAIVADVIDGILFFATPLVKIITDPLQELLKFGMKKYIKKYGDKKLVNWFSGIVGDLFGKGAKKIVEGISSATAVTDILIAVTSVGGFVSLMLDIFTDKKLNNKIEWGALLP